jgi:hypothetical protein
MYEEDYFNPVDPNDSDLDQNNNEAVTKALLEDRGLNVISRVVKLDNGRIKNKRIRVYSSTGVGSRIRDAETGDYYPNKVGSKDEDLFFKVSMATGECRSANGSNILFYCSPQHYQNHLYSEVDPKIISAWEMRRDLRLKEMNQERRPQSETIIVK